MRLSVCKNDPGFHPLAFGALVTLDGAILPGCITADEEAGWALVMDLGADGKPYAIGDTVATREVRGRVEIYVRAGIRAIEGAELAEGAFRLRVESIVNDMMARAGAVQKAMRG